MCGIDIVYYPDKLLRTRALNVEDVARSDVADTIAHLESVMDKFDHCVGLAANQIGSDLNIFVADASKNSRAHSEHGHVVLINPEIVEMTRDDRIQMREGCMSVPDLTGNVTRAAHIRIVGQGIDGRNIELEAHDFEARVFQHEVDHLHGKVFLDRVKSSRDVFVRKTYRS